MGGGVAKMLFFLHVGKSLGDADNPDRNTEK